MSDLLGPDFITLLVRDLDASYHFYSELVGLKESPDSGDATSNPGRGVIIWFRTDDAVSLHGTLKERAVPITTGLADSPFGKTFTFRDPDGYLITVHDGG